MILCTVGAELFHAGGREDGRTDMTKLLVAFRNFANAPKKAGNVRINVTLRHVQVTIVAVKSCKHYIF
jgi:hypothetical protein